MIKFILLFLISTNFCFAQKQFIRYKTEVNPQDFLRIEHRIIEVMGSIAEYCKNNDITFIITSMIRTSERNREIGAKSTTHIEGRAFDFSVRSTLGWNNTHMKKIENLINDKYTTYGEYSEGKFQKVLLFHN